jgi:hypothetical protein
VYLLLGVIGLIVFGALILAGIILLFAINERYLMKK